MKRITLLFFLSTVLLGSISAQIGGENVYKLLNFNYSNRVAGLGGGLISVYDSDPGTIIQNPSYISPDHHNSLAFNFTDYFSNVAYASALYSRTFKKAGSFAFEMRYVGYGKFTETTEIIGEELGEFTAGDYMLTAGWGRRLSEHFSIGASFKAIYSGYESYNSFGIAVDVAGSYYNEDKRLSLTLLFKNIGTEIKPFTQGNYEKIPFDLQFALSQRFAFLPVRYHISLHSLYRWNMVYKGVDDPLLEVDALTGEPKYPSGFSRFCDNLFRHFIVGIEIEPSKYFSILFSYNHNRHQEMKIPQRNSMAGFSYGFFINIQSIRVGFTRSHYAAGAVPNYITFACNIDELSNLSKESKKKKLERISDPK